MDESKRPPICDYRGSDYQRRFWDQGERLYEDRVEAIALGRLLTERGLRLLEVGAGAGRNSPRYSSYQRILLLDYSRTQLLQAKLRLGESPRFGYVVGDVYHLPFAPASFDGATMLRTLHHIAEPELALGQVRRCLRAGATFILEFANKRNLKAMLRWLIRRQAWNPFERSTVEFVRLNFNFHPECVRAWLGAAGFRVERQLTVSHFRLAWLKRLVPTALLVWGDALLQWSGNWVQWTPSVFVKSVALDAPIEAS